VKLALAMLAIPLGATGPKSEIAAIEVPFDTRAGEGATGVKRFARDGCYAVESEGSTGGAQRVRESQAGCHGLADVAEMFRRVDAFAAKEALAPAGGARAGVTLVRSDGSRWVAAGVDADLALARALDGMPGENQWYAKPPAPASGKGPQLLVLSAAPTGRGTGHSLEAMLAADGRWWCHRSVPTAEGGEPRLPAQRPARLSAADASARLGRILQGASPTGEVTEADLLDPDARQASVEVAVAGRARAPLRPRLARMVVMHFVAEMRGHSAACHWP